MIGHDHEGEDSPRTPGRRPSQVIDKTVAISVIANDILPPVAAGHQVIDRTGILNAHTPRHARNSTRSNSLRTHTQARGTPISRRNSSLQRDTAHISESLAEQVRHSSRPDCDGMSRLGPLTQRYGQRGVFKVARGVASHRHCARPDAGTGLVAGKMLLWHEPNRASHPTFVHA